MDAPHPSVESPAESPEFPESPESALPTVRQRWMAGLIMVVLVVAVQALIQWRFAPPEPPPLPEWYQQMLVL